MVYALRRISGWMWSSLSAWCARRNGRNLHDPMTAGWRRCRAALKLYQGEYLPETLYETWAAQERERMAVMFLEAADRLSDLLLHAGQYSEVVELGQRILAQDNCWERAYRHLMQAYAHLGDRGQVGRTYQRCVQTLRAELDLAPSAETQALYDQLAN